MPLPPRRRSSLVRRCPWWAAQSGPSPPFGRSRAATTRTAGKPHPARFAPQLCDPPACSRRRFACSSGVAGARQPLVDADLHRSRRGSPVGCVQARPSARLSDNLQGRRGEPAVGLPSAPRPGWVRIRQVNQSLNIQTGSVIAESEPWNPLEIPHRNRDDFSSIGGSFPKTALDGVPEEPGRVGAVELVDRHDARRGGHVDLGEPAAADDVDADE